MKTALCCLFLLCCTTVFGQSGVGLHGLSATDGKDYYLGWLYPSLNSQDLSSLGARSPLPFFGVYLLVSSYTDNQFSVSYFDDNGRETGVQSFQIAKRRALIVPVDRAKMRMDGGGPNGYQGEVAQWRSMHVTSQKPINIQFFSSGACSGGSYLALPVNMLGKEYVVESYNDNPGEGGFLSHENAAGYFMVIAAFDSTTVLIAPNATTAGGKQGAQVSGPKPFSISLQRGQCYMVKSIGDQIASDISGSTITSNKPISVIAGHENANIAGSDLGTYTHLDARDFMVEQMLPVEYWDTTGYISIPFVDATNAQGGDGDEYRALYGKPLSALSKYPSETSVRMKPDNALMTVRPFPLPVAAKKGVTTPVSFSSLNGCKFHVVQYDQRMQGTSPNPSPSQMSLIPMSEWKTSYMWYVASNVTPQEVYQAYYINLICDKNDYLNGTLQWASDGGPLVPIKSAGSVSGSKSIPDHPELMGVTIKLNAPRAYYAVSNAHKPFTIYNYGYRAIDVARNLGGNNESNFYFSYASPLGFAVPSFDSSFFTFKIDTNCSKWDICVAVNGTNKPKLKSITLLNDQDADIVAKPNSTTGYISFNTRFDPISDPDGKGEINLVGTDSSTCVKLFVQNPLDSAYAAVLAVDDKGNYRVAEIHYTPSPITDTIVGSSFDMGKTPWFLVHASQGYHRDSIFYPITQIGTTHCATTKYYSLGDSDKGAAPTVITGATLGGADGSFTITANRLFPVTLRPKSKSHPPDTLTVTVCFTAKDTLLHFDTMILQTDCFEAPVLVFGQGGTPLITATDYDFGPVVVGSSNCSGNSTYGPSKITIRNIGTLPFIVTKDWVIDNTTGTEFKMDAPSASRLPYTLFVPGDVDHPRHDSINLYFCYSPTDKSVDSTIIHWSTDIPGPFTDQVKTWSYLKGKGIRAGVIWDRSDEIFRLDSSIQDTPLTFRVHLFAFATAVTRMDRVYFSGSDAAEFTLSSNQLNQSPLEGFDMNPGDTIWVDFIFQTDITKPYPARFADRHAKMEATYFTNAAHTLRDTTRIDLVVTYNKPLGVEEQKITTEKIKAYIYGHQLIVELPNRDEKYSDCTLYDLLGRKITEWSKQNILMEENTMALPFPKISSGAYVLRLRSESGRQVSTLVMVEN